MGLGRNQLRSDIVDIGVVRGDCVALGVSLSRIGWVDGGADTLIDALLDAVGEEGTLMIPAFTRSFPLPLSDSPRGGGLRVRWRGTIPSQYIFDPDLTPPITGAVSTAMWKRPGSVRSRHPTNSVVAIGRMADEIIEGHDFDAPPFLPYSKLVALGGRALFIGLKGRLVALRHLAQYQAGLMDILPPRTGVRYRNPDGSVGLYVKGQNACVARLAELNGEMLEAAILREGMIGQAESIIADSAGIIAHLTRVLKERPEVNLCSNYACLWCRELERQLGLYDRVRNPRIYERNRALIRLTTMLNARRIGNSVWASRAFKILALLMDWADPPPSRGG